VGPTTQTGQSGILGLRPQQTYTTTYSPTVASTMGYAPTDIDTTMHTMTLNPPDENWYMDTGTTSHMTTSPDNNISFEFDPFSFTVKEF
ncbi:hypothetical protein Tco_0262722, partial [Tanacetum coccineum]